MHIHSQHNRALHSLYKYHKNDDDEASTSEICLAIINDIGRTYDERLIMNRAIETCPSSSFLSILDHGKKQLAESKECTRQGQEGDDIMSQKYHFLRLLHEHQQRCTDEGKYLLAKEFMEHEELLRKEEEARQVATIKKQHVHDRTKLVDAHEKQFVQFQECELVFVLVLSLSEFALHITTIST